ncbi:MAG: saccharopine dehydrogenase family protein [Gemmatimonadota bacterium]
MRFLVLGAGRQGSACAFDLLRQPDVDRVTLADLDPGRAEYLPEDDRLATARADFGDGRRTRELMAEHDVVLSAAPYYLNGDLARIAVETGRHFGDLGGNSEIVRAQLALGEAATAAGCTIVPDIGLAPGMVNVLAAEGIRRLDRTRSLRMYVGGLPQNPLPPLNYQVVYSLEGVLDYYTTPSCILRHGSLAVVEALSDVESLELEGVGRLEAFHTAGGASLQPWELEGQVEELSYKTLRYPGHASIMRAVRDLGLLSESPVEVGGAEVVPREVFLACVGPLLTHPEEPDVVALRVVAEGEREGRGVTLAWDLLDYADPETGISAMERTTGFSLAIVGLLLGRGVIAKRGADPAYRFVPYEPYVAALAERGIEIRYREG